MSPLTFPAFLSRKQKEYIFQIGKAYSFFKWISKGYNVVTFTFLQNAQGQAGIFAHKMSGKGQIACDLHF